jgi:hypothetical protein
MKIHQLDLLTAELQSETVIRVFCDTSPITEMIKEGLSGSLCCALTYLSHFFTQKQ